MSNVIRPTFGAKPAPAPEPTQDAYRPVRKLGEAAGHFVGLMEDDAEEGPVLRIVVGPVTGHTVETVALYPASPENEIDAEAAGLAILRALEIVEGDKGVA